MKRRDFLASGAASCVGAATARVCRSNHLAKERPRLGFSLYGMRALSIPRALELCASIGFRCVELPAMADWPGAPERLSDESTSILRGRLDDLQLRLSAIMENLTLVANEQVHQANLGRIGRACELSRKLSPNGPAIVETVMGGAPKQWESTRNAMVESLGQWAEAAKNDGGTVAIKAHVSGAAHLPEHIRWLLDQVNQPNLKAVFDYSHFQLRGVDMNAAWKLLEPSVVFIHIKDSVGDLDKFRFVLPGQGTIQYPELFRSIGDSATAADIVVEVSGQLHSQPSYDPEAAARLSYANIAPLFQNSSLGK